jgi:hypothetical protein
MRAFPALHKNKASPFQIGYQLSDLARHTRQTVTTARDLPAKEWEQCPQQATQTSLCHNFEKPL